MFVMTFGRKHPRKLCGCHAKLIFSTFLDYFTRPHVVAAMAEGGGRRKTVA
jgi:hypothetical protein